MVAEAFHRSVAILLLLVACAHAEVAVLHQGSKDPHSEGWTKHRPFLDVITSPVTNDLGAKIDSWSIHDKSGFGPPGHDGTYGFFLTKQQLKGAETTGWRLSVNMRIVNAELGKDSDSIVSGVVGSTNSYMMQFGKTALGKPLVRIATGENEGPKFEVDDPQNKYHVYELKYDPRAETASFYVDGVLRATDFKGRLGGIDLDNREDSDGNVFFGSTSNNSTGQAHYSEVRFEITPSNAGRTLSRNGEIVSTASEDPAASDGLATTELAPVPDAAAFKVSEDIVREVYREELAVQRTGSQKRDLARKLLQYGLATTDDDNGRYVLFRLAQDLAISAGDFDLVLETAERTNSCYATNAVAVKAEVLRRFIESAPSRYLTKGLLQAISDATAEAIVTEQFEIAKELTKLSVPIARKKRDIATIRQLEQQIKEIDELVNECDKVKTAIAYLVNDPVDPAANLTVGRYACLVKGEWESGISMLVLGDDDVLKSIAELEIDHASSTEDELKLGDGWWECSLKERGIKKDNALLRAKYWYQKALPEVSGLTKSKVEKRLEEPINLVLKQKRHASVQPVDAKRSDKGIDLVTADTFDKATKKGNWRFETEKFTFTNNVKDGMIIVPERLPPQFTLSLRARPTGVKEATCIAFYFDNDAEFVVQLAADGSCVIVDSADPRSDRSAKYGDVFIDSRPNEIEYSVRRGHLEVSVNGKQYLAFKDARLGKRPSDKFSIGVLGEWEIESIRISSH